MPTMEGVVDQCSQDSNQMLVFEIDVVVDVIEDKESPGSTEDLEEDSDERVIVNSS